MPPGQMFTVSTEWLAQNLYGLITALIVFLVGWYLSSLLSRLAERGLRRTPGFDATIAPILADLVRYAVLAVALIVVLGQFGVQTASILAVLGAVGLAVALALQGTLSNMAAGIMLLWLRPFGVGDAIDAEGIGGSVIEIGLFATRLKTYDGVYIFAPNQKLWSSRITNWSREPTRMVEIKIGINYSAAIGRAKEALLAVAADPRVLPDPAPSVFVSSLNDYSVQLTMRVWAKSGDWWNVYIDFMERAKNALDAADVDIARRFVDVRMLDRQQAGASAPEPGAGTAR